MSQLRPDEVVSDGWSRTRGEVPIGSERFCLLTAESRPTTCVSPCRQRSLSVVSLESHSEAVPGSSALRIAIVPGVTPGKWTQRWRERHPNIPSELIRIDDADGREVLDSGRATVAFLRLPIARDGLSVIRLYGEIPVLLVARDSELAGFDEVSAAKLAELSKVAVYPTREDVTDAMAMVAAGVGALRLPRSVARQHARRDVVAIPIQGEPETEIALCWLADETTPVIEEFVGIVRGRTASSSRGTATSTGPSRRRGR
jgi:DNA-binding transcriptional LysR family regulator